MYYNISPIFFASNFLLKIGLFSFFSSFYFVGVENAVQSRKILIKFIRQFFFFQKARNSLFLTASDLTKQFCARLGTKQDQRAVKGKTVVTAQERHGRLPLYVFGDLPHFLFRQIRRIGNDQRGVMLRDFGQSFFGKYVQFFDRAA